MVSPSTYLVENHLVIREGSDPVCETVQEDEWLQGDLAHTSHHTQAGLRRKTFIIMEISIKSQIQQSRGRCRGGRGSQVCDLLIYLGHVLSLSHRSNSPRFLSFSLALSIVLGVWAQSCCLTLFLSIMGRPSSLLQTRDYLSPLLSTDPQTDVVYD